MFGFPPKNLGIVYLMTLFWFPPKYEGLVVAILWSNGVGIFLRIATLCFTSKFTVIQRGA
jgi:hypothetical protein